MKLKSFQKRIILLVVATSLLFAGCGNATSKGNDAKLTKYQDTFYGAFDTATIVMGYFESEEAFKVVSKEVETELTRYHQLYDIYTSYEGINNVRSINKNAGEPVAVDEDIIQMLLFAKDMYADTNGAVNVAMGAVLRLWHDARTVSTDTPEKAYVPEFGVLEAASKHCNIEDVVIDDEANTVQLLDPEMSLDVGAIAKGYAVAQITKKLEMEGVDHLLISAGGNVSCIGEKPEGQWKVGIKNPDLTAENAAIDYVYLNGQCVVTSGVYERNFTVGDRVYHHIIDPDTLYPESRYLSVSIIAEDSGLADGLSTAIFNMEYEEGRAYIDAHDGIDAIWVMSDGEVISTIE